jgi:hypothetical protein
VDLVDQECHHLHRKQTLRHHLHLQVDSVDQQVDLADQECHRLPVDSADLADQECHLPLLVDSADQQLLEWFRPPVAHGSRHLKMLLEIISLKTRQMRPWDLADDPVLRECTVQILANQCMVRDLVVLDLLADQTALVALADLADLLADQWADQMALAASADPADPVISADQWADQMALVASADLADPVISAALALKVCMVLILGNQCTAKDPADQDLQAALAALAASVISAALADQWVVDQWVASADPAWDTKTASIKADSVDQWQWADQWLASAALPWADQWVASADPAWVDQWALAASADLENSADQWADQWATSVTEVALADQWALVDQWALADQWARWAT